MSDEELYVTCLCGALVNEANMKHHVEDCLKDDFIQKSVSLKIISSSRNNEEQIKERHVCATCVRCGHAIVKGQGSLITFYPSVNKNYISCCCYRNKSSHSRNVSDSICEMCKLPSDFHSGREQEKIKEVISCVANINTDQKDINDNSTEEEEKKCREHRANLSEFLESSPERDDLDSDNESEHEHSIIYNEIPSGPPCKLFHVAILPDYSRETHEGLECQRNYSLLIQILDILPPSTTVSTQTDLPSTRSIGLQVKVLGVYPEEIEELRSSTDDYSMPTYDPTVDAAFRSHLSSLIPCTHCERTFSPDRILTHESCCIERPKYRECKTPPGGEIPR